MKSKYVVITVTAAALIIIACISVRQGLNARHLHREFVLEQTGNYPGAIAESRMAVRQNPNSDMAHANLGRLLYKSGEYDEALKECREAMRINQRNSLAHDTLGMIWCQTGHFDDAVEECDIAVRISATSEHVNHLGYVLYMDGQKREGRARWTAVTKLGTKEDVAVAYKLLDTYPDTMADQPGN